MTSRRSSVIWINEAEIARIVAQPVRDAPARPRREWRPPAQQKFEQRTGLHPLQRDRSRLNRTVRSAACMSIIWPPIMPLLPAASASLRRSWQRISAEGWVSGSRENLERECQKRIAGEHGGCLVEGHMNGRPSAPEIVVVHAGQIVMHERIGVHRLDRRGHPKRAMRDQRRTDLRRTQHEKRPQPLAAGEDGVAHRLVNAGVRPCGFGRSSSTRRRPSVRQRPSARSARERIAVAEMLHKSPKSVCRSGTLLNPIDYSCLRSGLFSRFDSRRPSSVFTSIRRNATCRDGFPHGNFHMTRQRLRGLNIRVMLDRYVEATSTRLESYPRCTAEAQPTISAEIDDAVPRCEKKSMMRVVLAQPRGFCARASSGRSTSSNARWRRAASPSMCATKSFTTGMSSRR